MRELLAEALLERRLVVGERDRDIGAKRRNGPQRLETTPSGDDLLGAKVPGDLDRESACSARGPVDQHGLAGLELGALRIGRPRRHARIGDHRRGRIVKLVGESEAARRRRHGSFAHAAIGRTGHHEINRGHVIEPSDAVNARDKRKLTDERLGFL